MDLGLTRQLDSTSGGSGWPVSAQQPNTMSSGYFIIWFMRRWSVCWQEFRSDDFFFSVSDVAADVPFDLAIYTQISYSESAMQLSRNPYRNILLTTTSIKNIIPSLEPISTATVTTVATAETGVVETVTEGFFCDGNHDADRARNI